MADAKITCIPPILGLTEVKEFSQVFAASNESKGQFHMKMENKT